MGTVLLESHRHPAYPRLTLDLRADSRFYQARTFLDGKQISHSTKTTELTTAFRLAGEWYVRLLRGSVAKTKAHPVTRTTPTMVEVFREYVAELDPKKRAEALKRWGPIQHFWRTVLVSEVDPTTLKAFYRWRRRTGTGPHTLHKDVVLVRQILRHAVVEGMRDALPAFPATGSIDRNPRPWLTPVEWKALCAVSIARLRDALPNPKLLRQRQDLDDFMRFMVASMCRVDEALGLRFSLCRFEGAETGEPALVAQVTGKRGTRTIVAGAMALVIVHDRRNRVQGDLVFPSHHRDAFRELLKAASLYTDPSGFTRNFKSLRATAISFRLLEKNPNLLLIARNAGTSLAMIDQFYAKRLSAEMGMTELSAPLARTEAFEDGYYPEKWREDG